MTKSNLSKKLNLRGLSKQQEAFAKLVALEDVPVADAVARVYPSQRFTSACGRNLLRNTKVRSRLEQLQVTCPR